MFRREPVPGFCEQLLEYLRDPLWPVGRHLLPHGKMQAHVQERIGLAALRCIRFLEGIRGHGRLVFRVFLNDLGDLQLQRRHEFTGAGFSPRIDIHLPEFVAVRAENHAASSVVFLRNSHRSLITQLGQSGFLALQVYRPCRINQ